MQNSSPTISLMLRRIAALAYDSLLLVALFFVITAITTITLNDGESIEHWSYKMILLAVAYLFFDWFWRHGGQTLGMRAWRIRLSAVDDKAITRKHTISHFACGLLLFGLTLLFMFTNAHQQALHDRLSKTKIIRYNK